MIGVHTVRGVIDPLPVGTVLPHEHLICDFSRVTDLLDHVLNDVALAVDELAVFAAAGGTCVVDTTPTDLGRDPEALWEIANLSGVDVVMGTGWYRRAFYPPELDRTPTQKLAEIMVEELRAGVPGTGDRRVPAGIIGEIGVDRDHISGVEERVLRAAFRASCETGAAVTTHASMYPVGLAQLDIMQEEGCDPARVVIGHADTFLDADYHREVLRRGAWLQFDTVGRTHMNPDSRRAHALVNLVREGWLGQLLVSSDRCHRSDLLAFGGAGYSVVPTTFCDRLRVLGLEEVEIDLLTRHNPVAMLTW